MSESEIPDPNELSFSPTITDTVVQAPVNKALIDKWIFLFNIPNAMRRLIADKTSKGNIIPNSVQFSLKTVNIPEIEVPAISQRYASGNLHVSSHSKNPFGPLNIGFDVDNEFKNWSTIYEWLNLLHDEKLAYPDPKRKIAKHINFESYWTNLAVIGLDEYNKVKIRFTFTQAFPTKIGGINYDYRQENKIDSTATFLFSQLYVDYPNVQLVK